MLQQTTVKTVIPFFEKFTRAWPTVFDLAAAEEEQVLQAWAGLGYYSRARNLHACARQVVEQFGGEFPSRERELLSLPGIGPYTAAAIAAIAYGVPATPVDGNIERVVARLFAVPTPLPDAKTRLRALAATLTPDQRAGDFAQAMMDLGATVCTPKRPSCLVCPLQESCEAYAIGVQAELPKRSAKPDRPVRRGIAFVAVSEDGRVLLRRRPDTGLLARMQEVPSTDWLDEEPIIGEALRIAPVRADWWQVPGQVIHTFTHFRLELDVFRAVVPADAALTFWADHTRCRWVPRQALAGEALPTLMRKVIAHGLAQS
jgi:A/G-specific adenine glycosylase